MGQALQLVSGFATNPGATFTAITVNSGESATVPAFNPATKAEIIKIWSPGATAGVARLRSPRFHDNAQGIRLQRAATIFEPLDSDAAVQPLYPADALTLEITGGGAETDMLAFLARYDDLPGVQANLALWSDVAGRIKNELAVEVDVTSGTVGAYGTPRALNFSFDTLKASTLYALLGWTVSVKVGVVCIFGPDTGNQHVGGPGLITAQIDTREWFKRIADITGIPSIPIIQANNRGTTFVQVADVANATAVNVSLNMLELG